MTRNRSRPHNIAARSGAQTISSDRRMLAVMKERNRFLDFLSRLSNDPDFAEYRLEEGLGMARGLSRQARHCAEALQGAGQARAAITLVELMKGDFDLAEDITGGMIVADPRRDAGNDPRLEMEELA